MLIDGNKLMMSLNDWWYSSFGYDEETEDSKAIKTVVDKIEKSLKDFIPESCEDAISRADAVKVASGYCHPSNIAKELAKLPPVQPKLTECEDCVSRAELKKWLDMNFSFGGAARKFELFDRLDKELPPVTPKPKAECSCDQIKWERDMAIAQLNELGYGLGEKPKTGHWIEMRAEIEKLQTYKMFIGEKTVYIERDDVLAIIDKYKGGSEE